MSRENIELTRRMIEWANAWDEEAAQAHPTDDVEIVPLRAAMEGTAYRGPEAFAALELTPRRRGRRFGLTPTSFATRASRW